MEVALAATGNLPFSPGSRVTRFKGLGFHRLSSRYCVRAQTGDHSRERNNLSAHLPNLSEILRKTLPEQVREFPWKEAEGAIAHRLLHLGTRALKTFLLVGFFLSFSSDLVSSFLRSRELAIPLGLTIGVISADFLLETVKELTQFSQQVNGSGGNLLVGVGAVFACVKLLAQCVDFPGRMVLAHVSNGGLMQVLWLARRGEGGADAKEEL